MNEEDFIKWRLSCRKSVAAQIILNHLKKEGKIKNKKIKKIQEKINFLGYNNLLNSPHLEGKEKLKKKIGRMHKN